MTRIVISFCGENRKKKKKLHSVCDSFQNKHIHLLTMTLGNKKAYFCVLDIFTFAKYFAYQARESGSANLLSKLMVLMMTLSWKFSSMEREVQDMLKLLLAARRHWLLVQRIWWQTSHCLGMGFGKVENSESSLFPPGRFTVGLLLQTHF